MANQMLRSDFLGQTLERSQQLKSAPAPLQRPTQALFGKKAPKKAASGADKLKQQIGGFGQKAQKQVKKSAPAAPKLPSAKKAGSQISKSAKKATKGTKGWLGGAGGAKDLNKFYGELRPFTAACKRS